MTIIEGKMQSEGLPRPEGGQIEIPENAILREDGSAYTEAGTPALGGRKRPARRKVFLSTNLNERIHHYIKVEGTHWRWTGRQGSRRAPFIEHNGQIIFVGPYLWKERHGPIKPQHRLYGTCDFKDCVHPDCRVERPYLASLEGARRPAEGIGERTRAEYTAAISATTRREGTHLFAVGGQKSVRVRNRELDLKDLLWRHRGHRRHAYKPLITICEFPDCIEPDHEREGAQAVLAMLQPVKGHLIIPPPMRREMARQIAWQAAGETLPDGKMLVTLCAREKDCAELAHQIQWDCGKRMPVALRRCLQKELRRQQRQIRSGEPGSPTRAGFKRRGARGCGGRAKLTR